MNKRPVILSIAGFDPSGGAGVLADAKTAEQNGVYCYGVITANTIQNSNEFLKCNWVPQNEVLSQLNLVLSETSFSVVKIGLIEDWRFLDEILDLLKSANPSCKVILDPILSASAGFNFHENTNLLKDLLSRVWMITPNFLEAQEIFGDNWQIGLSQVAKNTIVYLKGGHREVVGEDEVYVNGKLSFKLAAGHFQLPEKHGSGCVLSSAIAANYALSSDLHQSCSLAKKYVEQFLKSSPTKLGYHS